jgi:uncharacterized protein (DUF1697 family)
MSADEGGTMTYVALLRGINVGGNRKVEMKRLRSTFEHAGMQDVQTHINSGNVIFSSESDDTDQLRISLERAIADDFGFSVKVQLRDRENINRLVAELPDHWANDDVAKCDVIFLGPDADNPGVLDTVILKPDIDDVRYVPGALLWRVERVHATRSGLLKLVGTDLYAESTVRNCNTLRKVAALMQ